MFVTLAVNREGISLPSSPSAANLALSGYKWTYMVSFSYQVIHMDTQGKFSYPKQRWINNDIIVDTPEQALETAVRLMAEHQDATFKFDIHYLFSPIQCKLAYGDICTLEQLAGALRIGDIYVDHNLG